MRISGSVIDSISLINTLTVAMAPSQAMGVLYQTIANNMGMAALNNVMSQQQSFINNQAVTITTVKKIWS